MEYKFQNTFCSQCGEEFGPGDHGFSSCKSHRGTKERMEEAMVLADRCWSKAAKAAPEFVEQYLASAEELLLNRFIVRGDEFREHCRRRMIFLPKALHHNTWVSGVRALSLIGWIEPIMKVTPEQGHNHMDKVTLWRSKITREQTPKKLPQLDLF